MVEELRSSETSVITRATRHNILEDGILLNLPKEFCTCVITTMNNICIKLFSFISEQSETSSGYSLPGFRASNFSQQKLASI
jgi:hypothetical protein